MDLQVHVPANVPAVKEEGHAPEEDVSHVVEFDGPNDPEDPLNW